MRKDVTASDVELHLEFLVKNGKPECYVPYGEFELLQEILKDAHNLLELREAKAEEAGASTMFLDEVKKCLGL